MTSLQYTLLIGIMVVFTIMEFVLRRAQNFHATRADNTLDFWDVLFGQAHITQKYPAKIGLRDDELYASEK